MAYIIEKEFMFWKLNRDFEKNEINEEKRTNENSYITAVSSSNTALKVSKQGRLQVRHYRRRDLRWKPGVGGM
jgi:hypothetical protein